jgi:hypothetical protein
LLLFRLPLQHESRRGRKKGVRNKEGGEEEEEEEEEERSRVSRLQALAEA